MFTLTLMLLWNHNNITQIYFIRSHYSLITLANTAFKNMQGKFRCPSMCVIVMHEKDKGTKAPYLQFIILTASNSYY